LGTKLVAWKAKDDQSLRSILGLQSVELLQIGISLPSERGDIDNKDHFIVELRKFLYCPVHILSAEVEK